MLQVGRGARGRGAVVIAGAAVVSPVVVLPCVPLAIIITWGTRVVAATGTAAFVTTWRECAFGARRAVVRLAGVALLAVEREITTVVTATAEIT